MWTCMRRPRWHRVVRGDCDRIHASEALLQCAIEELRSSAGDGHAYGAHHPVHRVVRIDEVTQTTIIRGTEHIQA